MGVVTVHKVREEAVVPVLFDSVTSGSTTGDPARLDAVVLNLFLPRPGGPPLACLPMALSAADARALRNCLDAALVKFPPEAENPADSN